MSKSSFPIYDICTLSSDNSAQYDCMIERFDSYLKKHPNLHAAHKHLFYHLVFFTKGSGHHTVDFENFEVQPGQIYFMIPGQVHSWSFKGKTDGYIINFSENFFRSFLQDAHYLQSFTFFGGISKNSVLNIPAKERQTFISLFETMLSEQASSKEFSTDMIRINLLELFIKTERLFVNNDAKKLHKQNFLMLSKFQKLIEEHYTVLRLPKEYAALLYVTPNYLNALCNDALGKSSGEIIRDRILLEAKRLLINANISIAEIAYQLNFKDNSYFTKFFKKYTGINPEEFRKTTIH